MRVQKLTREAFAEFGDVITTEGAHSFPINDGTTERFHDLAQIDVAEAQGKPMVSLFRSRPRQLPLQLLTMERHPLGTQAFIPLSKNPYLVLVAPCGEFDPYALHAFLAQAGRGVNYAKGVWHHALIALHEMSDFIVIDRGGPGLNCEEVRLVEPVIIREEDLAGG
ncbi:MAG: ureidoglycolate lyase [Verrucomicrobia bacterium]|nr:ureidoglycolate lyase [Verrucomicrobiota bacterium]